MYQRGQSLYNDNMYQVKCYDLEYYKINPLIYIKNKNLTYVIQNNVLTNPFYIITKQGLHVL